LNIELSLAFGLLTASAFGTADFIAKLSTNKIGFLRTAMLMQVIGSFLIIPFAASDFSRLAYQPVVLLEGIALGLINVTATIALYKGFEVGRLSIVSPIASSYPVVSILLAVLFLGEVISEELLVGICLVIVGVILVSVQKERNEIKKRFAKGTFYAIAYMVLGGILFFGLKPVSLVLGVYLPVLLLRWTSALVLIIVFFSKPRISSGSKALALVFGVAAFDTFANVIYNVGVSFGTVTVVSTVGGLFSAVTVLLARVFLKDSLSKTQVAGFLAISLGITVLGLVG